MSDAQMVGRSSHYPRANACSVFMTHKFLVEEAVSFIGREFVHLRAVIDPLLASEEKLITELREPRTVPRSKLALCYEHTEVVQVDRKDDYEPIRRCHH